MKTLKNEYDCISSRKLLYYYKYFFMLVVFLFLLFCLFIAFHNSEGKFADLSFISGIIIVLCICLLSFYNKTKLVYVNQNGLYYGDESITWDQVEKIKFFYIGPPLITIKFVKNKKKMQIYSILPISSYAKIKNIVMGYYSLK
jgi:hypothetical protein